MVFLLIALMLSALPAPNHNPEPPLLVSIDETARMLGISHRMTVKLLDAGELRGLKVGRRRMVPVQGIHEYIAARIDAAS